MLFSFSSSLMQPLHVGPHHMPHKPLDYIHRSNSKLIQKTLFKSQSECGFSLEGKAVMHWRVTARKELLLTFSNRLGTVSTSLPARLSPVHPVLPPPSFPLTRFLSPQFPIPTGTTISTSQLVRPGPGQSNWPRKASFLDLMACQGSSSLLAGY